MPSEAFKAALIKINVPESPLVCLEINHADLAAPIRLVRDTQDITVQGNLFLACEFQVQRPDDQDGVAPTGTLTVDNIGRDMTVWLEVSRGGRGATCRFMQVMRSTPDLIEEDVLLDLVNLKVEMMTISAEIGYQNLLDVPAVMVRFDPQHAPGLW